MAPTEATAVVSTLSDLIETCRHGARAFRLAAERVESGTLRVLFKSYAQQREIFAEELQEEVRRLGGEPEAAAGTPATIPRGGMTITSAMTGWDNVVLTTERVRGEDAALEVYEEALQLPLPPGVFSIVHRQHTLISEARYYLGASARSARLGPTPGEARKGKGTLAEVTCRGRDESRRARRGCKR